jgi:uncharacterized RDD family membrane protein YckC
MGASESSDRSSGQHATPVHPLDERYYVRGETEAYGPYQGRAVKDMIEQGKLLPNTGLARVGATEWIEIKDHTYFASLLPAHVLAAASAVRLPGAPGLSYPQAAADGSRRYAGFWIRLVAYIIDAVCLMVLYSVVGGLIFGISGASGALQGGDANQGLVIALVILLYVVIFAITIIYQVLFIRGQWQATPGKRLLGLHLITESGQRVSGMRALGRYFAYILSALPFYVGFMMIGWNSEKKGLHDMVCETRVVHGRL